MKACHGWIQTLFREKVKSQSLGKQTFNLKNEHLYMHSSTQISHAGILFHADAEFKVRFPIH